MKEEEEELCEGIKGAVEFLRSTYHGDAYATQRLHRVFKITKKTYDYVDRQQSAVTGLD